MNEHLCSVEGCNRPVRARGWCGPHYHRWQRGDLQSEIPIGAQPPHFPRVNPDRPLTNYERQRRAIATARAKDPEGFLLKQRARVRVNKAVRGGVLKAPPSCPSCGNADRKLQAHHADYSKPLDIEWLCFLCHRRLHHGPEREKREVRPRTTPEAITHGLDSTYRYWGCRCPECRQEGK